MTKGSLNLVLQSHLPFVRHPEYASFLEENWFFEAMDESYLPLLRTFDSLVQDKIPFRLTFSLSPTLLSMMGDELLQKRYIAHLKKMIALTEAEMERTVNDPEFAPLAKMYYDRYTKNYDDFVNRYNCNIISRFHRYEKMGYLELITTCATYAYLPLYESESVVIKSQINVAIQTFKKYFKRNTRGFWFPDLGYFPGLENYLKEAGIDYFFISAHGLLLSPENASCGVFSSYQAPNGVHFYARDVDSGVSVPKYAGHPDYREFYRDIGFDLPFEYVKDLMPDKRNRVFTGIKYYAITGSEDKRVYNIQLAQERIKEHAQDFIQARVLRFQQLSKQMDKPAVITMPFDTEFFGHGWFEGVQWLEEVFRQSANHPDFVWSTPVEDIANNPQSDVFSPVFSSWGNKGFSEVWFHEKNDWVYRPIFQAVEMMKDFVTRFPDETGLKEEILNQAMREVLLMQASDWPFILYNATDVTYADSCIKSHIENFKRIYLNLCSTEIDNKWVINLCRKNNLFPDIDYRTYID